MLLGGDLTLRGTVLVGLAAAATHQAERPLLVIRPAHLRGTWAGEARRRLGPAVPVVSVAHEADARRLARAAPPRCVVVTSYALLHTLPGAWLRRVRAVVADEGHKLCNARAAQTQAVRALRDRDRFILLCDVPLADAFRQQWGLPCWPHPADREDG